KQLCKQAQVARAGYYRWLTYGLTSKQRVDQQLMEVLKHLYDKEKGKMGYRRLTMEINRRYHHHYNHKRIRRLLVQMGLRA
ncbi:transposase, partial [Lactobacillus reuteri]|uniref:IS3 family transposase n=1 Tax=Limosilactobacillus reuteri TaxID=1598 RepID=UPI00146D546F